MMELLHTVAVVSAIGSKLVKEESNFLNNIHRLANDRRTITKSSCSYLNHYYVPLWFERVRHLYCRVFIKCLNFYLYKTKMSAFLFIDCHKLLLSKFYYYRKQFLYGIRKKILIENIYILEIQYKQIVTLGDPVCERIFSFQKCASVKQVFMAEHSFVLCFVLSWMHHGCSSSLPRLVF